jgi:hypothetical protein
MHGGVFHSKCPTVPPFWKNASLSFQSFHHYEFLPAPITITLFFYKYYMVTKAEFYPFCIAGVKFEQVYSS